MSNFIEHLWISRLSQNGHKDKEGTVPVVTGFTRGETIKQTGLILSAEKCDQTLQKDCGCMWSRRVRHCCWEGLIHSLGFEECDYYSSLSSLLPRPILLPSLPRKLTTAVVDTVICHPDSCFRNEGLIPSVAGRQASGVSPFRGLHLLEKTASCVQRLIITKIQKPAPPHSILRETCRIILAPELTWAHLNHSPPSPLPSPVSFSSFAQMIILGILPTKCPSWHFLSLVNPTLDICGLQCSGFWAGWILDGFSQWHVIRGGRRRRCLLHASSLLPCCSLAVASPLGLWLLPRQALLHGDGLHCFFPLLLQA